MQAFEVPGTVALRRFKRVMNLKTPSNNHLAKALMRRNGRGVDWMGSTKSDMATCIALGGAHGKVCPDPDGFIQELEIEWGVKDRRM